MGIAIFAVLAASLAALGFFLSARAARAAASASEGELRRWRDEAERSIKAIAGSTADARERREEIAALREQLREAKRKNFDQKEAARRLGGESALREELDKLSSRLDEARAAAAHGVEQIRALEQALQKAKAATPAPREAAPVPQTGVDAEKPSADPRLEEKLKETRDRADRAETQLAEARRRHAELDRELKAARGRVETEKRIYMVQKGELELAADRYSELRRRNEQLRREHDELIEAVKQAASEDRQLAQAEALARAGEASAQPPAAEPARVPEPEKIEDVTNGHAPEGSTQH